MSREPTSLARRKLRAGSGIPRILVRTYDDIVAVRCSLRLARRDGALLRLRHNVSLVVFCDFDGTFSVQDVGATLAVRHAGEQRPAMWKRYQAGEVTAWEYNMQILEGLPISRNVDYHTWRDTIDKLDFDKMVRTTRLVYNTAWLLGSDPKRPPAPRD